MSGLRRAGWVRVAPFLAFMALLALRGAVPADGSWGFDPRWLYGVQAGLAALLLAVWWREYGELAWQTMPTIGEALLAVGVGLAVFALWIQLDAPWMTIGTPDAAFVPVDADGRLQWAWVALRLTGAALVVPLVEELFWRSFLMRWVQQPLFEALRPQRVGPRAVLVSTFVFVLAHTLWLAAALAGLAYAWLYIRSGKLWLPVIAHAVTNGALGVYVVARGQWQFW